MSHFIVALFLPEIWQVATKWRQPSKEIVAAGYRFERGLWIIASDR
ncbi:hypothetical protein [Vibrio gallaecicus]|nr:hypothetical protein [Vibrio gallaecicus]MDN3616668.1 hypothetical protein [Vibrio gallaecicus]